MCAKFGEFKIVLCETDIGDDDLQKRMVHSAITWFRILVDKYFDHDDDLLPLDPDENEDHAAVVKAENDVYLSFAVLVERIDGWTCFEEENLNVDWHGVNEKVLEKIRTHVDSQEVLRFALPDFPMNEYTTINWRPMTIDIYATVLQHIKEMNVDAVISLVCNRNQKLRQNADEPNQQTLNASRGLAAAWNHNFVCSILS